MNLIRDIFQPGDTLSQRVSRSTFWVFALQLLKSAFRLVRATILARILAPDDFGLFGITMLALATLETFAETGFDAAIIQKKDDARSYLDAAWTIEVLRGISISLILFTSAPLIAGFFDEPRVATLVRAVSIANFLGGLKNIGIVYFRKDIEFRNQFTFELASNLADLFVSILAAFLLRSVWALIFGVIARNLAQLILSYLLHPYRPRLTWNISKSRELFKFGRWILGNNILVFLLTQGDDAFVGKFLSTSALGFYQLAYSLSNLAATEVSNAVARVTFPAYSKLQDDLLKLSHSYLRVLQTVTLLSFPVATFMFTLSSEFVRVFLGDKWLPVITSMQILSIFGLTRSINATMGSLLSGVGKPEKITNVSATQLLLMSLLIYPLSSQFGIVGVSIAVTVPNIYSLLYLGRLIMKFLNYSFVDISPIFFPQLTGIALMIICILTVQYLFTDLFLRLMVGILLGLFIYLFSVYLVAKLMHFDPYRDLRTIVRDLLPRTQS